MTLVYPTVSRTIRIMLQKAPVALSWSSSIWSIRVLHLGNRRSEFICFFHQSAVLTGFYLSFSCIQLSNQIKAHSLLNIVAVSKFILLCTWFYSFWWFKYSTATDLEWYKMPLPTDNFIIFTIMVVAIFVIFWCIVKSNYYFSKILLPY